MYTHTHTYTHSYCLALSDLCQQRASDVVKEAEVGRYLERQKERVRKALVKQANQKMYVCVCVSMCMYSVCVNVLYLEQRPGSIGRGD